MARALIFSNFLTKGKGSVLAPEHSVLHEYNSVGPGHWRANSYSPKKHIGIIDLMKRLMACLMLRVKCKRYDVLFADSTITGLLMSVLFLFGKGSRKLVIGSFNVPRHRKGVWKWLAGRLFRKVDHFIVHSSYDIQLAAKLYDLPSEHFTFWPFVREYPTTGDPKDTYLFEDNSPFILSFGGNARDYRTFFEAIQGTDLKAVVVAREYNLEGLSIPANVRAFCNIPLNECDKLASKCLFTVFSFDGSEPSCGQISIVTSFMLGKPTICTNLAGVQDYVKEYENGLFVRINDADDLRRKMLKLANDQQLQNILAAGARNWAIQNTDPAALQHNIDNIVTALVS